MMGTWERWRRDAGAAAVAMAALAVGCVGGPDGGGGSSVSGYGPAGGYASGSGSSGGGSTQPMLVVIDTGRDLSAQGGQGVGVYTQYQAGGHWLVQWTCDTSVTNLSCQFVVRVTVTGTAPAGSEGGVPALSISNLTSEAVSANASVTQASSSEVVGATVTYSALDGMSFDTAPGATILLEASVNGSDDGQFLFFVQDGKVNGGYQGKLSDPVMFVPSSP